jgi:hypothetical protein
MRVLRKLACLAGAAVIAACGSSEPGFEQGEPAASDAFGT